MGRQIVVDCEAYGGCPALGRLTWFGAADFDEYFERGDWALCSPDVTFSGLLVPSRAARFEEVIAPPVQHLTEAEYAEAGARAFLEFDAWLAARGGRVFWSDNPAFDWQWICDGFLRYLGRNPFGHSARRISDLYAGLMGDARRTQDWKRLRRTRHDHNPVHDAMGNAEALASILRAAQARA